MATYSLLSNEPCGECAACSLCDKEGLGDIWHVKRLESSEQAWYGESLCSDCLREKGLLW